MVAARAASLKKRKGKAPAKATLERRAREARKKAAGNVAVENVAAEDGEGKGFAAEVGVKDWSQQKSARQARTSGSVKKMDPSLEDLAARAEVVQTREPWENALALMRQRTGGWVHARVVSGRMLILLAQRFRVRGGEVQVLEGDEPVVPDGGGPGVLDGSELGAWVKTAELAWGYDEKEKEDAEEEEEEEEGSTRKRRRLRQKGRGEAAVRGRVELVELKEDDEGWRVQLVEGGAGGGAAVLVRGGGLWKEHRPIIMGSLGEHLLSIELCTTAYTVAHTQYTFFIH